MNPATCPEFAHRVGGGEDDAADRCDMGYCCCDCRGSERGRGRAGAEARDRPAGGIRGRHQGRRRGTGHHGDHPHCRTRPDTHRRRCLGRENPCRLGGQAGRRVGGAADRIMVQGGHPEEVRRAEHPAPDAHFPGTFGRHDTGVSGVAGGAETRLQVHLDGHRPWITLPTPM